MHACYGSVSVFSYNHYYQHRLVEELAVRVGTEKSLSHSRQSIVLQQRQPRVKGVVDLDLAASTNDEYTASTVKSSQVSYNVIPVIL